MAPKESFLVPFPSQRSIVPNSNEELVTTDILRSIQNIEWLQHTFGLHICHWFDTAQKLSLMTLTGAVQCWLKSLGIELTTAMVFVVAPASAMEDGQLNLVHVFDIGLPLLMITVEHVSAQQMALETNEVPANVFVARRCLEFDFFIDAVAALPLHQIVILFILPASQSSQSYHTANALATSWILPVAFHVIFSEFLEEHFYCLWWGLQNLSSYDQNLTTSTFTWDTSFTFPVRNIFHHEFNNIRRSWWKQRCRVWCSLVPPSGVNAGSVVGRYVASGIMGREQFSFAGILLSGNVSFKQISILLTSLHMHLLMVRACEVATWSLARIENGPSFVPEVELVIASIAALYFGCLLYHTFTVMCNPSEEKLCYFTVAMNGLVGVDYQAIIPSLSSLLEP